MTGVNMNRTLMQMKNKTSEFWKNRSKLQKILMISALAAIIIIGIIISVLLPAHKWRRCTKICLPKKQGKSKKNSMQKSAKRTFKRRYSD